MLPPASSSLIDDGNQSFMYVGFPCQKWEVALLRETSTKEFAQEVQSIVYHVLEEILHGQRRLFCFLKLKGTYRSFVRRLVSGEGIGGEMLNTRMMLKNQRQVALASRSSWVVCLSLPVPAPVCAWNLQYHSKSYHVSSPLRNTLSMSYISL
jgi:hypothetical protein